MIALLWRRFWLWMGECEAGSRRDYRTAHEYLRARVRLEATIDARHFARKNGRTRRRSAP